MAKRELIDISCGIRAETEKAYAIDDGTNVVWVPKSQVEMHLDGDAYICTMPEWLAKEKGLI